MVGLWSSSGLEEHTGADKHAGGDAGDDGDAGGDAGDDGDDGDNDVHPRLHQTGINFSSSHHPIKLMQQESLLSYHLRFGICCVL